MARPPQYFLLNCRRGNCHSRNLVSRSPDRYTHAPCVWQRGITLGVPPSLIKASTKGASFAKRRVRDYERVRHALARKSALLETKVMRRRLIELRGRCRVTSFAEEFGTAWPVNTRGRTAESKVLYRSGEELKALAVSSRRLVVVVDRLRESKKAFMARSCGFVRARGCEYGCMQNQHAAVTRRLSDPDFQASGQQVHLACDHFDGRLGAFVVHDAYM